MPGTYARGPHGANAAPRRLTPHPRATIFPTGRAASARTTVETKNRCCDVTNVWLDTLTRQDRKEFLAAVRRSRALHTPWVTPPRTPATFDGYLEKLALDHNLGFVVRTSPGDLVGVINVNEIVMGGFRSAYLGYYAFTPHAGRGLMSRGVALVISRAFRTHRLHRLEANIQPDNRASRALVQRLGFRLEGLSPRYLKIGGRWRDHERWALTVEEWNPRGPGPRP